MSDRAVHARYDGMEIVRYDRAGKWYAEPTNPSLPRQRLTIAAAVEMARWASENGGAVYFGVPGGDRFEHLCRAASIAGERTAAA